MGFSTAAQPRSRVLNVCQERHTIVGCHLVGPVLPRRELISWSLPVGLCRMPTASAAGKCVNCNSTRLASAVRRLVRPQLSFSRSRCHYPERRELSLVPTSEGRVLQRMIKWTALRAPTSFSQCCTSLVGTAGVSGALCPGCCDIVPLPLQVRIRKARRGAVGDAAVSFPSPLKFALHLCDSWAAESFTGRASTWQSRELAHNHERSLTLLVTNGRHCINAVGQLVL